MTKPSRSLETFPNPNRSRPYEIAMECPEFTSLCPLGGIESDADELKVLRGGAPDFDNPQMRQRAHRDSSCPLPAHDGRRLRFLLWAHETLLGYRCKRNFVPRYGIR